MRISDWSSDVCSSDLHCVYLHMRWLLVGLGAMFWASTRSKDGARRIGVVTAGVMLVLLVLVPMVGAEVNGARRWIKLGVSIQPSEFLKCGFPRSEEHTSELQSLMRISYTVCHFT